MPTQTSSCRKVMLLLEGGRLLLFLYFPYKSQGDDGCGAVEWRCGDLCISNKDPCLCGNQMISHNEEKWCCATNCSLGRGPGGTCALWMPGFEEGDAPWNCAEWAPASCSSGLLLDLEEACQKTCNEHPQDKYRGYDRSYVQACRDTSTCVKEGEGDLVNLKRSKVCTGVSNCDGEFSWCKEEQRKEETCPDFGPVTFTRCLPSLGGNKEKGNSGTKLIPGQCIENTKSRDGEIYHCLDRTDESPLQRGGSSTNQEEINIKGLKLCYDTGGDPGLECGLEEDNCIDMLHWCSQYPKECPVLGPNILTNDQRVCGELKFWRDKPCFQNGDNYVRCRGYNSGQCVERVFWGIESAKFNLGEHLSCKDGSDLYRPIIKAEEADSKLSHPQVWKTKPISENEYMVKKETEVRMRFTKHKSGLWIVLENNPFEVKSFQGREAKKGFEGKKESVNCGNHSAPSCGDCILFEPPPPPPSRPPPPPPPSQPPPSYPPLLTTQVCLNLFL